MTDQSRPAEPRPLTRRHVLHAGTAAAILASTAGATGTARADQPDPTARRTEPDPAGELDASDSLELAAAGRTAYRIYHGSNEGPVVRQAADELASCLRQVTGASFPVVRTPGAPGGGHLIVLGSENPLPHKAIEGIDDGRLGDDGFALRTFRAPGDRGEDSLWITGAIPRGTLYGAYWVLDRLIGMRWYAPDATTVPRRRTLRLATRALNADRAPHFRWREILAGDALDPAYRQHNLLDGRARTFLDVDAPAGIDTWSEFWPETQRDFRQLVTDPDLQQAGQVKLMEPKTRADAAAGLIDAIRAHVAAGGQPCAAFDQSDSGLSWDADQASKDFAAAHGGTLAAPVVDLINDVAGRVAAAVPGAWLETEAYQWSFDPPTGLRVADNVVVTVAPIYADFGHSLLSDANAHEAGAIRTWTTLAKNVVIWDYLTNFANYLQPFPNYRAMCQNLKDLAGTGVQGYFGEFAYGTAGAELGHLRVWILARLLWDPNEDVDALFADFCGGYYGAGGAQVQAYLELMVDALARSGARLPENIGSPVVPYLDFSTVRHADSALELAEHAVQSSPTLRTRVQIARNGIDYVILARRDAFAREAAAQGIDWDPDTEVRLARFRSALEASGMSAYREGGGDLTWLLALLSASSGPARPPKAVEGLPDADWQDYQELDLTLYPPVTTIVEDSDASNGYAVRMPGSVPDWGVQLANAALPDSGTWTIWIVAKVDGGTAPGDATALTAGIYPPFGNDVTLPVSAFADGAYHEVALPGTYARSDDHYAWIAPPNSPAVTSVTIDRIFAVRA